MEAAAGLQGFAAQPRNADIERLLLAEWRLPRNESPALLIDCRRSAASSEGGNERTSD